MKQSNSILLAENACLRDEVRRLLEELDVAKKELAANDPNYTPLLDKYVADINRYAERAVKAETELRLMREDEDSVGRAYLSIRTMIPGAFDTPHAPTSRQIYEITENALLKLKSRTNDGIEGKFEAILSRLDALTTSMIRKGSAPIITRHYDSL